MPTITISGTVIEFPSDGASPDWAPALIQFAEVTAAALGAVVGAYDVPPQQFVIDAYNPGSGLNIPNLSFASSSVQAAYIKYSVSRTTSTQTVDEAGNIIITYNATNPVGNKWQIAQDRVGNAFVSFTISDTGQFSLSTVAISGLSHTGKLTYSATSLAK